MQEPLCASLATVHEDRSVIDKFLKKEISEIKTLFPRCIDFEHEFHSQSHQTLVKHGL